MLFVRDLRAVPDSFMALTMQLPLDMISDIISALVEPVHPLQYGYDASATDTLLNLCLVSRTMHDCALPVFYRSIKIVTERQFIHLHDLFQSKPYVARYVTSIYFGFLPDEKGLLPENLQRLADLITAVQPSVRRMCLDRDFQSYSAEDDRDHGARPLICQALEGCRALEEFSSIRCDLTDLADATPPEAASEATQDRVLVCWPNWPNLKRLLLHNVSLDAQFVEAVLGLPWLTHLILPRPDWWSDQDKGRLTGLIGNIDGYDVEDQSRLRRVLFVFCQICFRAPESKLLKETLVREVKAIDGRRREGLEWELLQTEVKRTECLAHWMRKWVLDGSIWDERKGVNIFQLVATPRA